MPITVHSTPNPNAKKFTLPQKRFDRPVNVNTPEAAADHPLAAALLAIEGVYNVFMVQDFVTINKLPQAAWDPVEKAVLAILGQSLVSSGDSIFPETEQH